MNVDVMNATKYIKGALILDNVNMTLTGGKIYGLRGPNGSGKTMLLRLVAGFIRPSSGRVLINGLEVGKDIDFYSPMGVLIETPAFLPNYSGFKNLELLSQIQARVDKADIIQTMCEVGLNPKDTKKVRKYSLGMKQRLGIASALMEKPDLILLDEPTNALDKQGVEEICSLIKHEKERGALIILASHDAQILERVADEIFTVSAGAVEKETPR